MNDINGQISLFDVKHMDNIPPVLLTAGQKVRKVIKGDVIPMYVHDDKSWLCGKDNTDRGYGLKKKDGCYDCTWNRTIGTEIFTEFESANRAAQAFLTTHDVILGKDIKPISTVAYQYMRDADKRKMTSFYCELENGLYYLKEFMTFHHIVKNEALKKFMEQQEFKYCQPEKVEHTPNLKNMYRCTEQSDWLYAESGYSYAIG